MLKKLPELFDPLPFAKNRKRYFVSFLLEEFPRLAESDYYRSEAAKGRKVEGEAAFSMFPGLRIPQVVLKLKASLPLECQRTLEPFDFPVDVETKLVFVEDSVQAQEVDQDPDLEVVEMGDELWSARELVEDTLILAIPLVPYANEDAQPLSAVSLDQAPLTKSQTPFAHLQELMKKAPK